MIYVVEKLVKKESQYLTFQSWRGLHLCTLQSFKWCSMCKSYRICDHHASIMMMTTYTWKLGLCKACGLMVCSRLQIPTTIASRPGESVHRFWLRWRFVIFFKRMQILVICKTEWYYLLISEYLEGSPSGGRRGRGGRGRGRSRGFAGMHSCLAFFFF